MLKRLLERFTAWRRGKTPIAPPAMRGRIYERPGDGSGIAAKTKLKAMLLPSRVYRAAEKAWYRRNPETGELEKE